MTNDTHTPEPEDFGAYLAAKLADAALPIVETWQDFKHDRIDVDAFAERIAGEQGRSALDSLERALADILRCVTDLDDPSAAAPPVGGEGDDE